MDRHQQTALVKALARECGFDLCGIAPAVPLPRLEALASWLARGFHGEMAYLEGTAEERLDPRVALPTARSVIALATLYNTDRPYSTEIADPAVAHVSRYAWGEDYHRVIRARLRRLLRRLVARAGEPFEAISCVDDGPVQERAFAEAAGLGWIGKNACLISPELGSWLFLSVILCSLDLVPTRRARITAAPAGSAWMPARRARWSRRACSTRAAASPT